MIGKSIVWVTLSLLLVFVSAEAGARPGVLGDEDPYPVFCVNFTGTWKSDDSRSYQIQQKKCDWLRIDMAISGTGEGTTTIVPDNKERLVEGDSWRASVRHKWNDTDFGTIIQTYRKIQFDDRVVTETILLELANEGLLLESTYRTTVFRDYDEPRRESLQRIYHKTPPKLK